MTDANRAGFGPLDDDVRAALAFVLWHHQGGSSRIGQSMRLFLGLGEHERMSDTLVTEAKRVQQALVPGGRDEPVALPKIEAVAAKVHDSWMQEKQQRGVTSRKSESGEELMVPYESLSESAKELDRSSVRTVYRAIDTLPTRPQPPSDQQADGWQLVPKEPTGEMIDAACKAYEEGTAIGPIGHYRAMLRAAPPSPPQAAARCIQHAAHHEHWEDCDDKALAPGGRDIRTCMCADPENCTVRIPGYRCKKDYLHPPPSAPQAVPEMIRDPACADCGKPMSVHDDSCPDRECPRFTPQHERTGR